jgi:isopenicillin N synthase-like dioxygenase
MSESSMSESSMSEPSMSVSDFSTVPVVDVSDLLHGSPAAQRRVADEIGAAASAVGFLYVRGTGLPPRLFDDVLSAAQRFFALPEEEKMRVYIGGSTNHRGYVPEGEEVFGGGTRDRKEAFDLGLDLPADDPDYLAGNPMLGPNRWPPIEGFRTSVAAYYDAVRALGHLLFRAFAMALGESPSFFDGRLTKPPSQLRLIHYPYDAQAHDVVGIGAHTDYECFTLLRSTSPGLEVLNGAGRWIDVPPLDDTFVVNIGDMLETWSGGQFVATTHRVRKVAEERYSFPLFFSVDYETVVRPLERFASSDHAAGTGHVASTGLVAGEHLFAQTAQTFAYLRERMARGELTLPSGALELASFGREARQQASARMPAS